MPKVMEVEIPETSKIRESLRVVDFGDAYQATLTDTQMSVQDIYEAVFGDEPAWVRHLMSVRGKFAAVLGLKHDTNGIRVEPRMLTEQNIRSVNALASLQSSWSSPAS